MLRKLMKYELKATGRIMLPFFLAVVGLAAAVRLLDLWSHSVGSRADLVLDPVAMLTGLAGVAFALALVAAPVAALVLMIVRFKTNLLSDEGYVMFSLPVSTHKLVWSKLLTSAIWFIGAAAADVLAVTVLAADVRFFTNLWNGIRDLFTDLTAYYAANGALILAEAAVLVLVLCFTTCLQFYCPMAIGHSFARHKVLLSVAFYFVIRLITQVVSVILISVGVPFMDDAAALFSGLPAAMTIHGGLWIAILAMAVYGAVLYCLTIRMLHRRLNLE